MIFPTTALVALVGMVGETYTPGPVPQARREGLLGACHLLLLSSWGRLAGCSLCRMVLRCWGGDLPWKVQVQVCPPPSGEEESCGVK